MALEKPGKWRNDGVAAASSDWDPTGKGRRQRLKRTEGPRPEKVAGGPDGCVTPLLENSGNFFLLLCGHPVIQ